jgi:hypothetical protein
MCGLEGAAARNEIDGPNAKLVPDEGAHEGARVSRKYMDTVIRKPCNEPVGIKRNRGHNTTIRVKNGDAVRAKATSTALPVDYCWTGQDQQVNHGETENIRVDHAYLKSA